MSWVDSQSRNVTTSICKFSASSNGFVSAVAPELEEEPNWKASRSCSSSRMVWSIKLFSSSSASMLSYFFPTTYFFRVEDDGMELVYFFRCDEEGRAFRKLLVDS